MVPASPLYFLDFAFVAFVFVTSLRAFVVSANRRSRKSYSSRSRAF